MKITLITFFFTTLLYFSGPFSGFRYFASDKDDPEDSTVISIPIPLKMGKVSDEYINEKKPKIDSFYNHFIGSSYFSGGFIVTKNGHILFENYQGYSNLKNKTEINKTTPIHLASVSKVLTAMAILKLVQDDNIMLDQKVSDWLPKYPYQNTTIRTLLNHRSGLQHYSNFAGLLKKNWNYKKTLTNQDILDILAQHKFKLLFQNDSRFDYCNTNYVLLALIIEKATGLNYGDAMQDLIFKPLGMKDTYVFNYTTDRETASRSYKGSTLWQWDQYDALYGDKNIYSTPRDLVKFDLATYAPDFIKPEILQEAYKGYSSNPKLMKNYGLGMRMKEYPNGTRLLYHNGWWHGNNTSFVTVKKDTVTIICLSNKYSNRPYSTLNLAPIF